MGRLSLRKVAAGKQQLKGKNNIFLNYNLGLIYFSIEINCTMEEQRIQKIREKYLHVWQEYLDLEIEFEKIISYVPLTQDHFDVWSLKIGDLLIVLGSVMDSFFKLSLDDNEFDGTNNIADIRVKERHNMADYRSLFESIYALSTKKIYIRSLDDFICPFEEWGKGKSPLWWDDYQKVKHNRFLNKENATIKTLLYCMAGMFLLNVIHLPTRLVLRRLNLIKTYWNKLGEEYFESLVQKIEPIGDQTDSLEIFFIETNMFGYVYESFNPESKDEQCWKKLLALLKAPKF